MRCLYKFIYASLVVTFFSAVQSMGFDVAINNALSGSISVSKVPVQDIIAIDTGKVVQAVSTPTLPSIDIKESISTGVSDSKPEAEVLPGKVAEFFFTLTGVDLSKVNITENPFFVQRLVVKMGGSTVVGYISFKCSIFNTNPVITMESEDGYFIFENPVHLGGGGIHITVKKKY